VTPFFIEQRRAVLRGSALAALASLGACAGVPQQQRAGPLSVVKPPALRPGDTVGLFAPSGVVRPEALAQRVRNIEALGFRVKLGASVGAAWGGYAGTVQQRVDDFHALWRDGDVRALWAARGGSGASAILPFLDYALCAAQPKIVIGYSDITAVLLALWAKSGLVCFHGPTAGSQFTDYTTRHMRQMLMGANAGLDARTPMLPAPEHAERAAKGERAYERRVLQGGQAVGRLVGGNLTVLAALAGSPFLPSWDDALLFLEDVDEPPYRIDRSLQQLQLSDGSTHGLARAAGLMLGVFNRCEPKDDAPSLSLMQVMQHQANLAQSRGKAVPASYGMSFGHVPSHMTLPIGVRAVFDADAWSVQVLESPVDTA
jgi:muramoyltetrapeptide carboxypeptidase